MIASKATYIGIGAQKCASTWLHGVMQQMPQVSISDVKEVDFFSAFFDRGYEWYERSFATDHEVRHRGEISPSYFIDADSPARAAAYNPDLRIFVTLRDPVDRAVSNHLHEVRKGHVSGDNLRFETALDNNPLYIDQGRYAAHLSRWLEHFPAEQVHVLFQEDVKAGSEAVAREVADHLGLPHIETYLDRRSNESVVYRNKAVGETIFKLAQGARKRGLGAAIETAKAMPGIRQFREANRQQVADSVPPVEDATRQRLRDLYAPEVERLESLIGRSVPWPRFRA